MASIKVKFRPSAVAQKEGTIYYQVIQNRLIRHINTDYRLFVSEWNKDIGKIIIGTSERQSYLLSVETQIKRDIICLRDIVYRLEHSMLDFTSDEIIDLFERRTKEYSFFKFTNDIILQMRQRRKIRTSDNYRATLNSFSLFRNGKDILFSEINTEILLKYEAFLRYRGVSKNSSSFYMCVFRALYNRAVDNDLTSQRYPFKYVYTGIDKTIKRAISLKVIKTIKKIDLSHCPSLDFARDMFLFSFYTRGMSFIDMAYLKKRDLKRGTLCYKRRKTGQVFLIRWESCMQEILDKWNNPEEPYMLPILNSDTKNEYCLYRHRLSEVNKNLKEVAQLVNISLPLTMYVARHSWANAAKNMKIPLSVISESMGHDSEKTTRIYLSSFDTNVIDDANSIILNKL